MGVNLLTEVTKSQAKSLSLVTPSGLSGMRKGNFISFSYKTKWSVLGGRVVGLGVSAPIVCKIVKCKYQFRIMRNITQLNGNKLAAVLSFEICQRFYLAVKVGYKVLHTCLAQKY